MHREGARRQVRATCTQTQTQRPAKTKTWSRIPRLAADLAVGELEPLVADLRPGRRLLGLGAVAASRFRGEEGAKGAKGTHGILSFVSQSRLASQRGPCRRRLHGAPLGKEPRELSVALQRQQAERPPRGGAGAGRSTSPAAGWRGCGASAAAPRRHERRAQLAPLSSSVCNSLGLSPLFRLSNFLSGRGGTWGKASGAEVSVKGCLAAPKEPESARGPGCHWAPGHSPFQWSITYCPASVLQGL